MVKMDKEKSLIHYLKRWGWTVSNNQKQGEFEILYKNGTKEIKIYGWWRGTGIKER